MHRTRSTRLKLAAAAAFAIVSTEAAAAPVPVTSWELAGEFNPGSNPSGPWSYVTRTGATCAALGPALTIPYVSSAPSVAGHGSPADPYLGVAHIGSQSAVTINTLVFPPRGVAMHPGPSGQCAVVRFTAPKTGKYTIYGSFYALDGNGSGTNVTTHVFVSNSPYPAGSVNATTKIYQRFGHTFNLASGNSIDWAIGANGNYFFDTTGLHAVVLWEPRKIRNSGELGNGEIKEDK